MRLLAIIILIAIIANTNLLVLSSPYPDMVRVKISNSPNINNGTSFEQDESKMTQCPPVRNIYIHI